MTRRWTDPLVGLLLGCHPLPCLAVSAFAAAYAVAIGADAARAGQVAAMILAGQLVVGWSNDAIDAPRDLAAGRTDKPVSTGLVGRRTLIVATAMSAVLCLVLSFWLGAATGWLHVIAVLSAVTYNAWLKATALSPLPYLISFGLLPVIVTFAVTGPAQLSGPPLSHVIAAALLGGAAHAGNTVGDAAADAATGVRGLPQRLGPERSLTAMAGLVALAAIVLVATVFARDEGSPAVRVLAAGLLLSGVALAGIGAVRRVGVPGGRGAWRLTLLAVTLVIAGFLVSV